MIKIFGFSKRVILCLLLFANLDNIVCQIPKVGSFEFITTITNQNEIPNPVMEAIKNGIQYVVFYNDTIIVTLINGPSLKESYNYTFKNTGECIVIEKGDKFYVKTNAKLLREAFDFLGILSTDTIAYDTINLQYLGETCQKIKQKYNSAFISDQIINKKLSYFSKAEDKQIFIPLQEYSNYLGYEILKKVESIDTIFDKSIFYIDTIGLSKMNLKTYVNQKLGFQVVPDSVYDQQTYKSGLNSYFKSYKSDEITMDSFFLVKEAVQNLTYETLLDSVKHLKVIEPALLDEIENQYKTERIDEILGKYFYKKTLSTEKGRKLFIENLEFAGVKLKNDKSPLTLDKYIKEGYALDKLISELKGYHRLEVNLENDVLKDVIYNIFKMVLPEYVNERFDIQENKDEIVIKFRKNTYKLFLDFINDKEEDYLKLHYKNVFIYQNIKDLFTKIFVDLDLDRKIGICDFSEMRNLYGQEQKIDTFLICAFDKDYKIKSFNLHIGLSFHDSVNVAKQLKLSYLYGDPNYGQISYPLDFSKNRYLKSSQLLEFQKFYRIVGQNNKYIREMILKESKNVPYELTDLQKLFVFFFDYYLDESNFMPECFTNFYTENNNIDTIYDFNIAFPKIFDLLNRKLNIKNIHVKKYSNKQLFVQINFNGKQYMMNGTYEGVASACVKTIDQILASNKKYKYRIYTSLESNDFYKRLVILKNDEVPLFEKASGISLSTYSK